MSAAPSPWPDEINRLLNQTREAGLWRELLPVAEEDGPWVVQGGRRLLDLSSNDYLGLRHHPALKTAAVSALQAGLAVGAGASRYVGGSHALHHAVEEQLAAFKGQAACRLFSSGYLANQGALQALLDENSHLFSDQLNHASLIDGARLSRATVHVFAHNDLTALEEQLTHAPVTGRRLVAVESVYSMDGDVAPLGELAALCARHGALLLVDEAHATGVFGPGGRGLAAALPSPSPCPVVVVATLGKALGVAGGAVLGPADVVALVTQKARGLIYDTAPALALMPPLLAALQLMAAPPQAQAGEALQQTAAWLRSQLKTLGFDTGPSQSQIIPLMTGSEDAAMQLARRLMEKGVYARGIRYPTVARGQARVRLSLTTLHTPALLQETLLSAMGDLHRHGA